MDGNNSFVCIIFLHGNFFCFFVKSQEKDTFIVACFSTHFSARGDTERRTSRTFEKFQLFSLPNFNYQQSRVRFTPTLSPAEDKFMLNRALRINTCQNIVDE